MDSNTLDAVRDDLTRTVRRAAETLGMDIAHTGRDADAAAHAIGASLGRSSRRIADDVRDDVREGRRALVNSLDQHPLASLGIAAGVGLLVGLAFNLKR